MTFTQAGARLRQNTVRAVRPGLSRTRKLLQWSGSPDRAIPAIQITGSNGKGSVAAMLDSMLSHAGYRVGRFTSPHLHDERERIMIQGKKVTPGVFSLAVQRLLPALRRLKKQGDPATTFEAWTVLAALVFQMKKVDMAVLEVGMGGRLDATTVWQHKILTVLTNVHLEHTEFLGKTRQAICREKLGIARKKVPLVTAESTPELRQLIRNTGRKKSFPVAWAGRDVEDEMRILGVQKQTAGFEIHLKDRRDAWTIHVPCRGEFQVQNAALASLAIRTISSHGFPVSIPAIQSGMQSVFWPGRMELIQHKPDIYLDGSHNPVAAEAATRGWYEKKLKILMIIGIMQDKDVPEMVRYYARIAKQVWTVTPPDARGMPARTLAGQFQSLGVKATPLSSVRQAVCTALRLADSRDDLLVTGSLYILHPARQAVKRCQAKKKATTI